MNDPITIKQFIKNDWAVYADYDNRRSLPHIMDGFKVTQRKAMYTATTLPKNDKPIRVSQFAAEAAKLTCYHHGESSMVGTVVNLAQDFPGSNNIPFLEAHGQFGNILSNTGAAPRYIHTKLHRNWGTFFKKEDQDIVEHLYDDGDKIEPKYFIPILPIILLNGSDGTGNGFKSFIFSYGIPEIVKACKEIIKYGNVKTPLIPHINGWNGTIEKIEKQIVLTGNIEIVHSTKLLITELPPKYNNDKYKTLLNSLIDNGTIKDYENKSTEEGWEWIIHAPRTTTSLSHDVLLKTFGLVQRNTETFVCWGMDDRAPMTFDSPESLMEYWYSERIKLYDKSIAHQIVNCSEKIIKIDMKMKFIRWCLKNDFRKLSRGEFVSKSVECIKNLTHDAAEEFVSMPMYKITTDEVSKLENEIDALVDHLEDLESLTAVALMERNIKGL